jgi:hypothetical protein
MAEVEARLPQSLLLALPALLPALINLLVILLLVRYWEQMENIIVHTIVIYKKPQLTLTSHQDIVYRNKIVGYLLIPKRKGVLIQV